MKIKAEKITGIDLMQWACSMTTDAESKTTLRNIYECEHSPIRTQLFKVTMIDIPTFVSVHFVRHTQGVTHFVKSNRDDRGGNGKEDRMTPINHGMLINAQALINMSRKRLCLKAHPLTREVMIYLKEVIRKIDPALAMCMIRECYYRGKICHELKPCGLLERR